jgi:3-oxoacyl-[acyl-carrier-protein] synthase III
MAYVLRKSVRVSERRRRKKGQEEVSERTSQATRAAIEQARIAPEQRLIPG